MNSKKIHNDYACLDRFSERLKDMGSELANTAKNMAAKLQQLNEKGFQDANFESLSVVFQRDVDYLSKIRKIAEEKAVYIDQLSHIIKEYYKVEL